MGGVVVGLPCVTVALMVSPINGSAIHHSFIRHSPHAKISPLSCVLFGAGMC